MAIDRTVNNVMVSKVVNMSKIEIIPIIDDNKMSSIHRVSIEGKSPYRESYTVNSH